jgi:hypothetical protein
MPAEEAGQCPSDRFGILQACPPEDCGGIWGFAEFLEVLADSDHGEHDSMLEWVGGAFDADHFDRAAVNESLSLIAAR